MKSPDKERRNSDYDISWTAAIRKLIGGGKALVTVSLISSAVTLVLVTDAGSIRTRLANAAKGAWNGALSAENEPVFETTPVSYAPETSSSEGEDPPPIEKPQVMRTNTKLNRSLEGYRSAEGRHIEAPKVGIDMKDECVIIYSQTDIVLLEMRDRDGEVFAVTDIKKGACVIPFSEFPEGVAASIAYGQSVQRPESGEDMADKHYSLVGTAQEIETNTP